MKDQSNEIYLFIKEKVNDHAKDIVAHTASRFSVTRTTVHRHLNKLINDGSIIKYGRTRRATYLLASEPNKELQLEIKPGLSEDVLWNQYFKEDFNKLSPNISEICQYGFTEIVNNVIEHSQGKSIMLKTEWKGDAIKITVGDDGIGIFKKIKTAFHLEDERESILQLSKGKLTTDPEHHTGEGIFFSSRAFDYFTIYANGLGYIKDNKEADWFFESRRNLKDLGTFILMEINLKSERILKSIFNQFTDSETLQFDKTHIVVKLSRFEEERYISRSQAKRILFGIEKFKHVVLDFKDIKNVGQAFVDEVFRVYNNKHPEIDFSYINANEDVEFMIKRGILG